MRWAGMRAGMLRPREANGNADCMQGYEMDEEELRISLDDFKAKYTNDGVPEYVLPCPCLPSLPAC